MLDILLRDNVDDAARRDAERRDDRQRHEAECHERVDARLDAELKCGGLRALELFVHLGQRAVGHDARDLEHDVPANFAVFDHHDAAVLLHDLIRSEGHIVLIRADDDDVVRIMRDGGRHRACLQAVALNVAESNVVCVLVALDDRDLQDVLLEIDPVGIPIVGRGDLAGDHAGNAARASVLEIIRRQRPNVERVMRTLVEIRLDLRGREVEPSPDGGSDQSGVRFRRSLLFHSWQP